MSMLYLVPTPIGNLEDITLRAQRILQEVDVVLCEDTRTTGRLLQLLSISANKLRAYHLNNEHKVVDAIVRELEQGATMALVSDAGSPAISDPGFLLVRACVEANIEIDALPGATAFVPALTASGFPCDRFVFEGFLPHKKGRQTRIQLLAEESRTVVLYESPYRLVKCLHQLAEACGEDRKVSVGREISKKFQEYKRGSLSEVAAYFEEKGTKGEFVIVLEGKGK